jgi:hypothetical protein
MNSIQFIKLLFAVLALSLIAFVAINIDRKFTIHIIEYLEAISLYILGITGTAVFFLLKHMDGISSSTTAIKNSENKRQVDKLQKLYQTLNQEGISNILLSITLFILAKIIGLPETSIEINKITMIFISIKFSCFVIIIYSAYDQIRALHTVMNYRRIIETNKK